MIGSGRQEIIYTKWRERRINHNQKNINPKVRKTFQTQQNKENWKKVKKPSKIQEKKMIAMSLMAIAKEIFGNHLIET